jgi:hypothetical protein
MTKDEMMIDKHKQNEAVRTHHHVAAWMPL